VLFEIGRENGITLKILEALIDDIPIRVLDLILGITTREIRIMRQDSSDSRFKEGAERLGRYRQGRKWRRGRRSSHNRGERERESKGSRENLTRDEIKGGHVNTREDTTINEGAVAKEETVATRGSRRMAESKSECSSRHDLNALVGMLGLTTARGKTVHNFTYCTNLHSGELGMLRETTTGTKLIGRRGSSSSVGQ
jgi:hypothetical protein